MPALNEISQTQLMRLIGTPDAPAIVDVCMASDFEDDPRVIPTAQRCPHDHIEMLGPDLQGKRVVIICQKGKKLSQGAAALLRTQGLKAEYLAGGIHAWRDADLPLIPAANLPPKGSTWVTRHRPKIDRIACPWLIRRFVDPDAKFLYVQPGEVARVAENFNAIPFDIEGVELSHHDDDCSFDAILKRFALDTPPLQKLATLVRAADTNRHDLAPEAAGLLAISVGLSRAHKDDLDQLEAGMVVYDALYRWARDGQGEGHDWAATRKDVPS